MLHYSSEVSIHLGTLYFIQHLVCRHHRVKEFEEVPSMQMSPVVGRLAR